MAGAAQALIDELKEASGKETTRVADLVKAFGNRGSGAFLVIPALIGVSPVAAIPSVPTIVALVTLLFAAQIAMGRTRYWLPDVIDRRELSSEKLSGFADKTRGAAKWLDGHLGRRLEALTSRPAQRIAGGVCCLLCLMVPPLELVPFAAALPFAAIGIIGLALVLHDGIAMLLAMTLAIGVVGVTGWWLLF